MLVRRQVPKGGRPAEAHNRDEQEGDGDNVARYGEINGRTKTILGSVIEEDRDTCAMRLVQGGIPEGQSPGRDNQRLGILVLHQ